MNGGTTDIDVATNDRALGSLIEDPRLVVSINEAAALLGVSRSFAYELARRGELQVVQLGRRQVVPKHVLLQLVGLSIKNETFKIDAPK
jgi:excisionase family DNA binding protein